MSLFSLYITVTVCRIKYQNIGGVHFLHLEPSGSKCRKFRIFLRTKTDVLLTVPDDEAPSLVEINNKEIDNTTLTFYYTEVNHNHPRFATKETITDLNALQLKQNRGSQIRNPLTDHIIPSSKASSLLVSQMFDLTKKNSKLDGRILSPTRSCWKV
jgi:hypothetical protein